MTDKKEVKNWIREVLGEDEKKQEVKKARQRINNRSEILEKAGHTIAFFVKSRPILASA